MVWSVANERFQENLEAAKAYYDQHWTLCAPRTATMLDKPIGQWLSNLRRPGALDGHPECGGERDTGGVGDQVVLAARPAPVNGASSGLGASFNARMWEPSTAAREKSRAFALRAWRGGPRAVGARLRPRSTRPGGASRSCPSRSQVPAACVPRRSRCAARTGCPGTPAGPDAACARGAGSGAQPWAAAARSLPITEPYRRPSLAPLLAAHQRS